MKKLHPKLDQPVFDHLFKVETPNKLLVDIGRNCRYKNWNPSLGSIARTEIYTIGSIQKDYKGDLCYRVYANSYNDTFGRCMQIDQCEFINN